jgi:hypothetical protein
MGEIGKPVWLWARSAAFTVDKDNTTIIDAAGTQKTIEARIKRS